MLSRWKTCHYRPQPAHFVTARPLSPPTAPALRPFRHRSAAPPSAARANALRRRERPAPMPRSARLLFVSASVSTPGTALPVQSRLTPLSFPIPAHPPDAFSYLTISRHSACEDANGRCTSTETPLCHHLDSHLPPSVHLHLLTPRTRTFDTLCAPAPPYP